MSTEWEELQKREQFIELTKEVYPLIDRIAEIFAKADFGDSARITVEKNGYVSFTPYQSKWMMSRLKAEKEPTICFDYRERFAVKEEK